MGKSLNTSAESGESGLSRSPQLAILTGGRDKPYALGMAECLIAKGIEFDFIGSDEVNADLLHRNHGVRFLNLRGEQSINASFLRKSIRVVTYYVRLLLYAITSSAPVFHVLWNNKFEYFDRTLLLLLYRVCGRRVVFTAHNVNIRERDGSDGWLNRLTLRIQYQLVSHILVHTDRMRDELISDFGLQHSKVSVIPFGVNKTVPDTDLTRGQAREHLGLNQEHKVVLFFGNIAPYKGLELLVEAAAAIQSEISEIRLLIVGRPKGEQAYWARIQRRISELHLGSRVIAQIEYVPDAETEVYFKAADVFVLPYKHVFQSGVLFLGYGFGVPVIATDVGSLKEDVVEGRTGLMCRPADAGDLARCLKQYFRSPLYQTLPRHRSEIRAFVEERHSWHRVGCILEKVYGRLSASVSSVSDARPSSSYSNSAS